MRTGIIILLLITLISCNENVQTPSNVITQDLENFWKAYDQITATQDTTEQIQLLQSLFLDKASAGQQGMLATRNYTAKEYVDAINTYPKFWTSIRKNTSKAFTIADEFQDGIEKFKKIYPKARPAKIYFTVGALRSNGTTLDSMVLIGSELACADQTTVAEELPERFDHLKSFFESNPKDNMVFLNIHEYVHTQQKSTSGNNLLAQTVIEGVPEYLTEIALGTDSPNPQISFGKKNDQRIKEAFKKEMFSPNIYNWIWNSPKNEFGIRDLAYYVGYKISEGYYKQAEDKSKAIKEMIELDYNDEKKLIDFVNTSKYFDEPLSVYKERFEKSRPTVVNVLEIENSHKPISPNTKQLTVEFSEPMNTIRISTDLGQLGKDHYPNISKAKFTKDGKFLVYDVTLEPNKTYEMVLHWNMRNLNGIPLVPYTVKFKTGK